MTRNMAIAMQVVIIFALVVIGLLHYTIVDRHEKAYDQLKSLAVEEARTNDRFRSVLEEHSIIMPSEMEEINGRK